MKKLFLLSIVISLMMAACNLGQPPAEEAFEDVDEKALATVVQATLEAMPTATPKGSEQIAASATALANEPTAEPTQAPTLTPTPTETPTLTPTVSDDDPLSWLGAPSWTGEFSGQEDGFYTGDDSNTTIDIENDALVMTSHMNTIGWHGWSMNYRSIGDYYLESVINVKNCSGTDEYGMIFRAPDYQSGYFLGLRCNGEYNLRIYDESEYESVKDWTDSDQINSGSNQTNRVGIYATGDDYRIYFNGSLVDTIQVDHFDTNGHFGFFIAAYQTAGFQIQIDKVRYWTFN
ncbi:MAG: hypothetical protein JW750_07645 [Anaerolineaceae bacterium]|nr:hypothetical protein [Anaerolineaceae bacterium]